MKKSILLILSFYIIVLLNGCEKEDNGATNYITGIGDVVTETLDLSSFQSIKNTGVANIYVTVGDTQSVVLKAQQNIIDVITYEVNSSALEIGIQENTSIRESKGIVFEITIPEIYKIELIGVGDFELSGDLQDELYISLIGVGTVRAYNLEVDVCHITSTGVGNCQVRVNNTLNVTITGVGSVYYKGNPTISSTITGLGKLVDDND
ncbi:hypothetical protein ES708_21764 [subsurface metagenome]